MKSFLRVFKSEVTKDLISLKVIRLELNKIQHDMERLLIMEQNVSQNKKPLESIVSTIRNSFGVALWIKNADHRFLFANKVCCETILKCNEDEFESLTYEDFENDPLSRECVTSDKLVMENRKTMRFIEYARYGGEESIFLDVVKSPRIEDGEVIGTIGSGVIITDSIPEEIKKQKRISYTIEIPLGSSMDSGTFADLLERRGDGKRIKSEDETYRRKRKDNNP